MQQDLRLMSLPPGERITNKIAHDICVREAAAATIDGSIASLGKNYVITLQAIRLPGRRDARPGADPSRRQRARVARSGNRGDGHAHQAGRTAQLDPEIESSAGTGDHAFAGSSPELHRGLSRSSTQGQFLAAVPLLERAVALDPNFAMAYYYLSVASDNAGDIGRRENCQKGICVDRPCLRV